jgi:hypothetical protein
MNRLARFAIIAFASALPAFIAGDPAAQTQMVDPPLRGTTFFGGAGMAGAYVADMVVQLRAAGVANVRLAAAANWSAGAILDGYAGLTARGRDGDDTDFGEFGRTGSQFNLIGYSYGGLRAAQVAADYTSHGGRVDHLVLTATPIDADFLAALQADRRIGSVIVIDLTGEGDPIQAGMSSADLVASVPMLGLDFIRSYVPSRFGPARGHFHFADPGPEGRTRRTTLAERLYRMGLR